MAGFNAIPKTLENDESCAPVTIEATPTYSIGNRVWIDTTIVVMPPLVRLVWVLALNLFEKWRRYTVGSPTETDADGRYCLWFGSR